MTTHATAWLPYGFHRLMPASMVTNLTSFMDDFIVSAVETAGKLHVTHACLLDEERDIGERSKNGVDTGLRVLVEL